VRATNGHESYAVACGTDGRFVLEGLVADVEYSLEAQGPRHATGTAGPFRVLIGTTAPVEIRLPTSRFLDLVVLDAASAAPVPDATVSVDASPILLPGDPPTLDPTTDAKGHVRVGPVPSAAVDLTIQAQGYLQASRSIPVGSEGAIEVNLAKALLLSGRVLRPDGSPARGATVTLRFGPDAVPILHTAGWLSDETDEAGEFSFAGLPRVRVPLVATFTPPATEGAVASEPETGAADPDAGASDCVIRLRPASESGSSTLTIRVVDPDGLPIPSASIFISTGGSSLGTSFSNGRYVHHLPQVAGEGTVTVGISNAADADGKPLPLARAQVEVPTSQTEVTIRLERSEPVRGVVRGPDGAGLAGVQVVLTNAAEPGEEQGITNGSTGDDGTFTLFGAMREPCRLWVVAPRGFLSPDPVDVRPGAPSLELRLRAGATAVVTVLDPSGVPLAGATVGVHDETPGRSRRNETDPSGTTDATGRATLLGLDPAHVYLLDVAPSGTGALRSSTERWVPGDTTIRLARALRITGVVRDRHGRAVPTARVEANIGEDVGTHDVDGAGRFVLEGLREGTVGLRAVPPGGAGGVGADSADWTPVQAGALDVVLTLDLGATLVVRVEGWSPEEAVGAAPWASAPEAILEREGGPDGSPIHRSSIADDGTIRFHRLDPAHTYTLWIAPVGDRSLRKSGVRAGADVRVRLEAGKTLSFRVVGPTSFDDVTISFVGCPLPVSWWRVVKSDGTADVRGYPPGRYTVKAQCVVDGVAHVGQVSLEAGGPRVDLPVAPEATEGR